MKIVSILLIFLSVGLCSNTYFLGNVECACQQFVEQGDCSNQWNCQWITITQASADSPALGYCTQQECSAYNQAQCANAKVSCYYQAPAEASTSTQVCYPFTSCSTIQLAANQTCFQANVHCQANPAAATSGQSPCVTRLSLSQQNCSSLKQAECGSTTATDTTVANDGICYWNGNSCTVITQCSQINNKEVCNNQFNTKNACYWSGTCVPLTCADFTTSSTCTYVSQSPLRFTNIQPCLWTALTATTGTCANATVYQLTSISVCASNTGSHYRWVGQSPKGFCAQCNPHKYVFRNQCECEQLLQQSECIAALDCNWTNNACQKNTCNAYIIQQQCAQVPNCYWNASAAAGANCTSYTTCASLSGTTNQACYSQSIYCPGTTGTTCQSQNSLPECSSIKKPNICYNSIGKEGYCTYPANGATLATCKSISSCSEITSRPLCTQFASACIWNITLGACISKTCSQYLTESSCTFVQPNMSSNVINVCYWNPNIMKCQSFDNSIGFDVNTCFASTGRTHHWSEPATTNRGLCVPCHFSSILNVKSQCSCTELVNYTDCAYASPKCMWDSATSTCQKQNCAYLTSQASCVLSNICYWNNKNMSCNNVGSNSCSSLAGNTQQECLAQSLACPGTSNGKCSTSINSCSSFGTYYQCFGSVGTDGICQWNEVGKTCAGITTCTMITSATQCELVANACQWVAATANVAASCQNLTCSAFTTSASCTYVRSSPNQNYAITQCQFLNGACIEGQSQLSSSTCYVKSGRTQKWVPTTDGGSCEKCSSSYVISVLFIVLLMLA